ncbi:MAG: hypothetical protein NW207_12075 [Cytophagales bacterium]|nr:hypothetical protein [Cytophagales bacterium]
MKKIIKSALLIALALNLTSCYINTVVVGKGGSKEAARSKSWYILGNRISEANPQTMAGGATDYTVDQRFNFVDYIINSITFGLIGSRTVIVKK